MSVESNPPGATVIWSHDGLEPFHPWPADSWEMKDTTKDHITPFSTWGFYGDTFFVTVEKDGYLRPLPRPVQLYGFRNEHLTFDLIESSDAVAERMAAEGKVLYNGKWVDPEVEGIAKYEGLWIPKEDAFRRKQRAAGLIEYDGKWMTAAEAADQERRDKEAAGFVQYKDRWVSPDVAAAEKAIDDTVAKIAEDKVYPDLSPPKVVTRTGHPEAQIRLYNPAQEPVEFLLSGPASRRIAVAAQSGVGNSAEDRIILPPGRYDIVIMPQGKPSEAHWGNWPLAAGVLLEFSSGVSGDDKAPVLTPTQ